LEILFLLWSVKKKKRAAARYFTIFAVFMRRAGTACPPA